MGRRIYYFFKLTVIWWLIFLGAIHIITILSLILEWDNQRNFTLDEHLRISMVSFSGALIFSISDTFKKICIELKKKEQD